MNNRNLKKTFLSLLLLAAVSTISAQTNGSNSPYSRYGFGLLSDCGQGYNKGMGGLSYGLHGGQLLNYKNPASYASIDSLSMVFDVGFSIQNSNLKSNGSSINARNSSVDYLAAAFRVRKGLGFSLGMMPFSTIGYNMSQTSPLSSATDETTQTNTFSGDGGLRVAYVGVAWAPFKKGPSVGLNAGYLWGDMTHIVLASFSLATIDSRRRTYSANIGTYKLDLGLQQDFRINRSNVLTVGATYGLGHSVNNSAYFNNERLSGTTVASSDPQKVEKAFELPHTVGVGAVWNHRQRLSVGVDYTLQMWKDVKSPQLSTDGVYSASKGEFMNMHRFTVGADYVPNPVDGVRWRHFVHYRAGFSYATPYTKVNGLEGPSDYSVSLGVGLPIVNRYRNNGNRFSLLNITAQYEHVKPKFAGMVSENYFRLAVGLTFSESWFQKRKVQ